MDDPTNYINKVLHGQYNGFDPRPEDPGVRVRQGIFRSEVRTVDDTLSNSVYPADTEPRKRFQWISDLLKWRK